MLGAPLMREKKYGDLKTTRYSCYSTLQAAGIKERQYFDFSIFKMTLFFLLCTLPWLKADLADASVPKEKEQFDTIYVGKCIKLLLCQSN